MALKESETSLGDASETLNRLGWKGSMRGSVGLKWFGAAVSR